MKNPVTNPMKKLVKSHSAKSRLAPLAAACLFLFPACVQAQQADNSAAAQPPAIIVTPPPPATRLETILALKNTVIVKGFTEIAAVTGEDGASVRVIAVELTDPAKQDHVFGLAIEIHTTTVERTSVSYVDYDEIDGLLNAIDYLTRADATVTQLANFTALYRTRGDLEVSNFISDGTRMIAVKSIQIVPIANQLVAATAYFRIAAMGELRQQLIAGQKELDKIKTPAR